MAIILPEQVFSGYDEPIAWRKTAPATQEAIGVRISTWQFAGWPGAASAPGGTLNGEALTSPVPGQIEYVNPSSGVVGYLGRCSFYPIVATSHCRFFLCDRIWQNTINPATTTEQTISAGKGKTVVWPSRDRDGSDLGVGVVIGLEVEVATPASSGNTTATIRYTNTALTTSRVGGLTSPHIPTSAPAGTFVPFELQSGDRGISSIEGVTLGTSLAPTGSPIVHLVAYRIFGELTSRAFRSQTGDVVTLGMPRIYDGSVPWVMILPDSSIAAGAWEGMVSWTKG